MSWTATTTKKNYKYYEVTHLDLLSHVQNQQTSISNLRGGQIIHLLANRPDTRQVHSSDPVSSLIISKIFFLILKSIWLGKKMLAKIYGELVSELNIVIQNKGGNISS